MGIGDWGFCFWGFVGVGENHNPKTTKPTQQNTKTTKKKKKNKKKYTVWVVGGGVCVVGLGGLGPSPKAPIPNPQSPIPNPH